MSKCETKYKIVKEFDGYDLMEAGIDRCGMKKHLADWDMDEKVKFLNKSYLTHIPQDGLDWLVEKGFIAKEAIIISNKVQCGRLLIHSVEYDDHVSIDFIHRDNIIYQVNIPYRL